MKRENILVDRLKDGAKSLGACEKADEMTSWTSLAKLIFSPQGAEFLQTHQGFPSIEVCRQIAPHLRKYGIYVDVFSPRIHKTNSALFVGNTKANVYCHGASSLFTFMVMHGAELTVHASSYAVVRLYNLGGTIKIVNDGTAKILQ